MPGYSTVIFDLDGTLLDTLQDLGDSVNRALARYGYPPRTAEEIRRFVGNGTRRLVCLALPGGEKNPCFEDCFAAFREDYARTCHTHTHPYDGIPALLFALRAEGSKLGVVSNKPEREARTLVEHFFPAAFGVIIGQREGLRRKPAPDSLFAAMDALGASPAHTLYVGDSEVDVQTAAAAAVPCLAVTWGFRTEEELRRAGATAFAETAADCARFCVGHGKIPQ